MNGTHSLKSASIRSLRGTPDLFSATGILRTWVQRSILRREMRRLLGSGSHLVRDIGLDEAAVRRDVALPFWQAGPLDRAQLNGGSLNWLGSGRVN